MRSIDHASVFISGRSAVIGGFWSSLLREGTVSSALLNCSDLLLCFFFVGIQASGIILILLCSAMMINDSFYNILLYIFLVICALVFVIFLSPNVLSCS